MARHTRFLSEEKIYHVVLKGINADNIFTNEKDCSSFLQYFKDCCKEYDVKIYAYCIMSNHVHLLLKFSGEDTAGMFKSFGAKYVPKYNYVHSRVGPLFNGRYYSSPVNHDEYLLSVVRYIHLNPVNAGICKHPGDYRWSSYNEYKTNKDGISDRKFVQSILTDTEFDELHIVDNKALDEFFIQNARVFGSRETDLAEYVERNSDKDFDELVRVLKLSGASKRQIARALNVDIRKI